MCGVYHYKTFDVKLIWLKFNREFKLFSNWVVRPMVGEQNHDNIHDLDYHIDYAHHFAETDL